MFGSEEWKLVDFVVMLRCGEIESWRLDMTRNEVYIQKSMCINHAAHFAPLKI
jgi:hypothetical protein